MFRIAVLASTRGTDLQTIIDAIKAGHLNVELACVISNKKNCYALERAHHQGFKTHFVDPKEKSRVEFDREMAKILEAEKVDLIVLVGYMRILTPFFTGKFHKKIINVHPALIPKYCGQDFYGANVHEAVLKAGEKETGMTIHYVEEGVDTGEIILQKKCAVLPTDTPDTLKERVQTLEKEWYPKVIRWLAEGKRNAPN
ncbi:phosphoribosylglycinamide formyltransferase [Candidatus Peregrinibacteria bacterium]|nr:phosphoribosylglycinamide formyltransferase [Candidatus Peregrinibacteria bacterium]